jgi:hypothetical protein
LITALVFFYGYTIITKHQYEKIAARTVIVGLFAFILIPAPSQRVDNISIFEIENGFVEGFCIDLAKANNNRLPSVTKFNQRVVAQYMACLETQPVPEIIQYQGKQYYQKYSKPNELIDIETSEVVVWDNPKVIHFSGQLQ